MKWFSCYCAQGFNKISFSQYNFCTLKCVWHFFHVLNKNIMFVLYKSCIFYFPVDKCFDLVLSDFVQCTLQIMCHSDITILTKFKFVTAFLKCFIISYFPNYRLILTFNEEYTFKTAVKLRGTLTKLASCSFERQFIIGSFWCPHHTLPIFEHCCLCSPVAHRFLSLDHLQVCFIPRTSYLTVCVISLILLLLLCVIKHG